MIWDTWEAPNIPARLPITTNVPKASRVRKLFKMIIRVCQNAVSDLPAAFHNIFLIKSTVHMSTCNGDQVNSYLPKLLGYSSHCTPFWPCFFSAYWIYFKHTAIMYQMHACCYLSHSGTSNSFVTPWVTWDSPGKNTGVVTISFSRGSSQPRDRMHICLADWFFTTEPPGEAKYI